MATPIDEKRDNPYVAYSNYDKETINMVLLEKELCSIAQMDAWHDHHTISGLGGYEISNLVKGHTRIQCDKPRGNEDDFMFSKLIKGDSDTRYCRVPEDIESDTNNIEKIKDRIYKLKNDTIFTEWVDKRYTVMYCDTTGTSYNNSLIQGALHSQGIDDDYFLIKDTAKSNYSNDIKNTGINEMNELNDTDPINPNQTVTNLLTSAGIYDPGPTTTPYTQSGVEQGFIGEETKSKFGILNFGNASEAITHYPPWEDVSTKFDPVERLIYSKFDCKMVATTNGTIGEPAKYITQTNSTLYIKDESSVFYVNKSNSDKATDLTELEFKEKLEKIGSHRFPPGTQFPFPEAKNIALKSGIKKIFSKKVGDSGQALQTLRHAINYKELIDGQLIDKTSNGIHGFVSYDRVAIVSSIIYGAPIVIFITERGFVIYISNNLIEKISKPETKFAKMQSDYVSKIEKIRASNNKLQDTIESLKTVFETYNEYKDKFYNFLNNVIVSFNGNIQNITGRDNVKASKYDKEYKLWLSKLYIYNQLANAIGNFEKRYTTFESLFDGNNFITSDQTQSIDKINTLIDQPNIFTPENFTNIFINSEQQFKTKLDELDNVLLEFKKIQLNIDELSQIYDIYTDITSTTSFDSIQGLNTNSSDEKKINSILKKQNPQIADSIASITIAEVFQNPGCLSSFLTCFSSSKMPSFGPFYEICRFYQNLQGIDSIIDAHKEFMINVREISRPQLFYTQMEQIIVQLENNIASSDKDNALLYLSNDTIEKLLNICYRQIRSTITGGKRHRHTKKGKGKKKRITKKKYILIKGGSGESLYNYLIFNSFVSILQLYQLEIKTLTSVRNNDMEIQKIVNIDFIDDMINDIETRYKDTIAYESIIGLKGLNEIFNESILSYDNDIINQLNEIRDKLFTIQKKNEDIKIEYSEITGFNLFTNNIVGPFNTLLFNYIETFLLLNQLQYTNDNEKYTDYEKYLEELKIKIDIYDKNVIINYGLQGYNDVLTTFKKESNEIQLRYELTNLDLSIKETSNDINEVFIDYVDKNSLEPTSNIIEYDNFATPQYVPPDEIEFDIEPKKESTSSLSTSSSSSLPSPPIPYHHIPSPPSPPIQYDYYNKKRIREPKENVPSLPLPPFDDNKNNKKTKTGRGGYTKKNHPNRNYKKTFRRRNKNLK